MGVLAHINDIQSKLDPPPKRNQAETAAELDALLPAVQDPGLPGRALRKKLTSCIC